ncbi:ABC transporter ATP-binding protein [Caldalkalibacillus mannanilyticus]|uniref:ABC transporter ATP-binding protein n=1 Tax=Caldalkalibacillus mannanilyticus TaxID=1418 RepID=UPI0004697F00|nr:ABC transporter ATP-binding protein [Caldalkalibacillus mannanilyticus]
MMKILEAKGLTKIYGGKKQSVAILKDINLAISQGEFISIMGPSGSGKSTLLYNISGMDRMSSGSVLLNGKELSSLTEKELAHLRLYYMGFIFQQIHLLKNLSIFDNIVLSAYLAKKDKKEAIDKRAKELMKKTGIIHLKNNDIMEVSGGQLQRVAICRALINEPEILFGDEPTGALNSTSASEVLDILADFNDQGTTIMLVTHDVKVAAKTERVIYMLDGDIVGEKHLGKYQRQEQELRARENNLSRWLMGMGF